MATYLLTWNPARWPWDNLQDDLDAIKKQGFCLGTWSCGVTKKIVPDDRVFLIKLGKEAPRGILASGWAISDVFEGDHWDEDAASEGKTALYIDVHFDSILDPEQSIFSRDGLEKGIYSKMNWQPQASGITIPDDVANQLEIDWANFIGQTLPLPEGTLPEEADTSKTYKEGATKQIKVNIYERSSEARSICIKHFGLNCSVCGFNFQQIYGQIGVNFIHVHHLKSLSEVGEKYELNPIEDLRPVCPNCHAMLHKRRPAYTIQELQVIMQQTSNP